jgi:hypothetical protein
MKSVLLIDLYEVKFVMIIRTTGLSIDTCTNVT